MRSLRTGRIELFPFRNPKSRKTDDHFSNRLYTTTYKMQQRAQCNRGRWTVKPLRNDLTAAVTTRYENSRQPNTDAKKVEGGEMLSFRSVGRMSPRTETVATQRVTPICHLDQNANYCRWREKVGNICRTSTLRTFRPARHGPVPAALGRRRQTGPGRRGTIRIAPGR